MLIQILEPQDYSPRALDIYRKMGDVILGPCSDEKQSGIDVLVVRLAHQLDAEFLKPYSGLVAIVTPTTGVTHIDLDYCTRLGICVHSLQGHQDKIDQITSTSELCFGLMLSLIRKIPLAHHDVVVNHHWQRDRYKSHQLAGMTLGIIGLGRTGSHMANYAKAFGMHIIAYDPYIIDDRFKQLMVNKVDLDQLCRNADVLSIHANEHKDNANLIDHAQIRLMKKSAIIINTARGSLLNETAAGAALQKQQLGGIACDVLANETQDNFPVSSPLLQAASQGCNVILTPHIGGCTEEAMHSTEVILADHLYQTLGSQHG